jgi:hypothetical protein
MIDAGNFIAQEHPVTSVKFREGRRLRTRFFFLFLEQRPGNTI